MLSTNLEYYKPSSIDEAAALYNSLKEKEKKPIYYSGGTEILTLGRLNLVEAGAVIDLKNIPECLLHEKNEKKLITGSCLTLTEIEGKNYFPLLSAAASEVADHTARNKITLGGNICGQIFYREAVLPFLLANSDVHIAGTEGVKTYPILSVFDESLQLKEGQFLTGISTDVHYLSLPYIHIKRRKQWETGYPLLTAAGLKINGQLRFAFSGLCPFPFRSLEMELELNRNIENEEKVRNAISYVPSPILDDVEGSSAYRLFVLKNILLDILREMGER
ncbi:FAD binding domain-containing protein [Metabacillus fastidiosus]|uniref:FAD binding domain-containing protein n=1 Tax=Metabacillus fastidiosus TaxID=1458 RepID=A0ABU6P3A9_9BACI|nr:FAD binding domain-containing protein [Metabacillus fastidiosus]MED4402641.1 FAD binding domain-containing protein [Metabacillus fastidiosus]